MIISKSSKELIAFIQALPKSAMKLSEADIAEIAKSIVEAKRDQK